MSRLIEKLDEGEHLQPSDDGYIVYWTQRGDYLTASHLREIADELDRRNKTWHERVMQDVGGEEEPSIESMQSVLDDLRSHPARKTNPLKQLPKIKPLVWERVHTFAVQARTAFGEITITEIGPFRCEVEFFDDEIVCQSINSARKKAEAEYERRVRACLE